MMFLTIKTRIKRPLPTTANEALPEPAARRDVDQAHSDSLAPYRLCTVTLP